MSFWQKVQKGVNRAAEEVKEQATATRLNLKIGETRTEVRRKVAELGEAALPLVRDGTIKHERLSAIAAEIEALEEQVTSLERELARTRGDVSSDAPPKATESPAPPTEGTSEVTDSSSTAAKAELSQTTTAGVAARASSGEQSKETGASA